MSSREEFRERLRALVNDAHQAGEFDALEVEWTRLVASVAAEAPPRDSSGVPQRFGLVGDSPPMRAIFELIEKIASATVPVLVLGETGTGKELVALALHENSPRHAGPFVAENCAAVPAGLIESELFGHVRGSFTGAVADRPGAFVSGDGGTVFLDEIGDMPLDMQAKLLRVLQDGEVRPVGSNKVRRVDVRLVAATNRNLEAMCAERSFREDLFYRLNVISLNLPPLRERGGDVVHLAEHFLERISREMGRELSLSSEALKALQHWSWPGNVRELENELRRAAVFSSGRIRREDLSPGIAGGV